MGIRYLGKKEYQLGAMIFLSYLKKGEWFPIWIRRTQLYWRRQWHSPTSPNEYPLLELLRAWEPINSSRA